MAAIRNRYRNRKHKSISALNRASWEPLEARQYLSTTIYVSPSGSNSASGSISAPLKTLQAAANVATAGTTVIVEAGNYAGFQLSNSGTASAPIVFNAQPGAVINGAPGTSNGAIDISSQSYVTLEGFTINGSGQDYRACIWGGGEAGSNVVGLDIQNNTCTYGDWWGILIGFANNSQILDNTCSYSQVQHGIYLGNSSLNDTIAGNTCFDNHGCGIEINADGTQGGTGISTGILIDDNLLYDNALSIGAEINLDGVQNSTVENNLIYGGQRNGIALYQINGNGPSSGDSILNNTIDINSEGPAGYAAISILDNATNTKIYNNILSAAESTMTIDPASLVGLKSDYNVIGNSGIDPTGQSYSNNVTMAKWQSMGYDQHSVYGGSNINANFADAATGDFHLVAGSVAITAGNGAYGPSTDMAGSGRATSGAVTAGAYTYGGTVTVTAPNAPSGLTATAETSSSISLSWTDNGGDETGFSILRQGSGGAYTSVGTVAAGTTTFTNTGLSASTSYTYEVMATGPGGNSSASNSVTASTSAPAVSAPNAPSGLTATAETTATIALSWTDNGGSETGFKVLRKSGGGAFAQVGATAVGTTTFTDTSLSANTSYTYEVLATGAGGNSTASNIITAQTDSNPVTVTAPNTPSGLTATAETASTVALSWTDNGGDSETGFAIYCASGGGAFAKVGTTAVGTTTFTDASLTANTSYTYEVFATGSGGNSSASNVITAQTSSQPVINPTDPSAPSALTVSGETTSTITIDWTDNGDATETGFNIMRMNNQTGVFTQDGYVAAGSTTFTDIRLTPGHFYSYEVMSVATGAVSGPSNAITGQTMDSSVAAPNAPSNLTATAETASTIALSWTNNGGGETGFKILRLDSSGDFGQVGTAAAGSTTFTDVNLTAGTSYVYEVIAAGPGGNSGPSNMLTISTSTDTIPTPNPIPIPGPIPSPSTTGPDAPTNLAASLTGNMVQLTWSEDSTDVTSFQIERIHSDGSTRVIGTVDGGTNQFSVMAHRRGITYTYQVVAVNDAGTSDPSNTASVQTPDSWWTMRSAPDTAVVPTATIAGPVSSMPGSNASSNWNDFSLKTSPDFYFQAFSFGSKTGKGVMSRITA